MADTADTADPTDLGTREGRKDLATRMTERLCDSLDQLLADRYRVQPGTRHDYFSEALLVDSFSATERCPRRLAGPTSDYRNSVAMTRRRIGLLAIREVANASDTSQPMLVSAAVDRVMTDPTDWPMSLRDWVDSLDTAGQAAVAAAALTWADAALRLVGRDARVTWAQPAQKPKWNVPGRLVQLSASVDAVFGGVVSGEKLLILSDAVPSPGDRLRAGFTALVRTLGVRHAPVRVTLGSPATGFLQPITVTEELLQLSADRAVEMVGFLAHPASAGTVTGRWCNYCHLLGQCEAGQAQLAGGSATI
ncbi:MAG: hypothetical protein WD029_07580 [Microthrixaceae bacterium]